MGTHCRLLLDFFTSNPSSYPWVEGYLEKICQGNPSKDFVCKIITWWILLMQFIRLMQYTRLKNPSNYAVITSIYQTLIASTQVSVLTIPIYLRCQKKKTLSNNE